MDEQQLSQLRKLLEQNLPPVPLVHKKKAVTMNLTPILMASSREPMETTAGLEHDPFSDACFTMADEQRNDFSHEDNNNGTTGVPNHSQAGSLLHSPVLDASVPGSPLASASYMFQPICQTPIHPSTPVPPSMMSNNNCPGNNYQTSSTTTTMQRSSLPASCCSSPYAASPTGGTPVMIRSRNDSGHSSSYPASIMACNQGGVSGQSPACPTTGSSASYHVFDSGVSSISTSPFYSPMTTPVPNMPVTPQQQQQQQLLHHQQQQQIVAMTRKRSGSGFTTMNGGHSRFGPNMRTRHSSGPGFFVSSLNHSPPMSYTSDQMYGHPEYQQQPPPQHPHHMLRHSMSMEPPTSAFPYSPSSSFHTMGSGVGPIRLNRSRHFSSPFCSVGVADQRIQSSVDETTPVEEGTEEMAMFPPVMSRCNSVPTYEDMMMQSTGGQIDECQQQPAINEEADQSMGQSNGSSGVTVQSPPTMDQDLQTTLDDLRDCDNDFSRFAQELEDATTGDGVPGVSQ